MKKGFTVIELIIVIAIFVLLSAIGFTGIARYRNSQTHKFEVESVLSLLNNARTKALSGENGRNYNVVINSVNKTATLNLVQVDPGDPTVTETVTLGPISSISTTLPSSTVEFTRFTGSANNTGNITITSTGSGFSKTSIITIYTTGLAALQ